MKEQNADHSFSFSCRHTVAFRFCGKLLFGSIKKIDGDTKMATVVSSMYPNPKYYEDAELRIPIESLIGCCDTASLMESWDYKDRFVAEYIQLAIRVGNLDDYLKRDAEAQKVPDAHKVRHEVLELLQRQYLAMKAYMEILKERAKIEKIEL